MVVAVVVGCLVGSMDHGVVSGTRSKKERAMSLERRESRQGLQTFEVHVATSSGRVVIRHQRGICCKDGSTDPKSAACGSLGSAGKHDRAGQGQLHQRGEQGSSVSDLSQRRDQCYLHTCTSSLVVSPSSEVSIGSKAPRLSLSSFQDSDHNSPRDGLRSADKTSCCAPELAPSAISYGQNQDRGEEKKWNTEPLSDVWTKYKSQKKKKKEKKKKPSSDLKSSSDDFLVPMARVM